MNYTYSYTKPETPWMIHHVFVDDFGDEVVVDIARHLLVDDYGDEVVSPLT